MPDEAPPDVAQAQPAPPDASEPPPAKAGFFATLFPAEPRRLPGHRFYKIVLRSVHVLFAGVLTGAVIFDVGGPEKALWLALTLISGLLILAVDLYESGAFLLQFRGLVLLTKIVLLCILSTFGAYQALVLCLIVIGSVLSSHAPSSVRYFVLIGRGKIKGACSKG